MAQTKDVVGAALVVGGGIAGVQASLDLAESGYKVYLVESQTGIGGRMAQLDKTFPTNDCSTCIFSPKLVTVGQNPNIELLSYSEVDDIQGGEGHFKVRIRQKSRYIRKDRCKACGDCATACPVKVSNQFDQGLSKRSATYRLFPQTIPQTFVIEKADRAPCVMACPAHINVQGYVQLIGKGKYKEAVELIYEKLPLPGVLGRVCPHPCEDACRRREKDEPIAICRLKRFAADQIDYSSLTVPEIVRREEKVAVVGSGPAGLSAAYYLALNGYGVTIFEASSVLGGWLRLGIPEYRLPKDVLDKEIDHILSLGVGVKTNTALGRDFTLEDLSQQGYKATFLGIGCQKGARLGVPGEESEGVILGIDLLRNVALGVQVPTIKKAVVIGGGSVAVDVARTVLRLAHREHSQTTSSTKEGVAGPDANWLAFGSGATSVTMVSLESLEELPAARTQDGKEDLAAGFEEGVRLQAGFGPKRILANNGKVVGVEFLEVDRLFDAEGRFRPTFKPGTERTIEADAVILAIGQLPELSFFKKEDGIELTERGTIYVDPVTKATAASGVFAGGDAATGPSIVVEAVAAGREAAESIHRYLNGLDQFEGRPWRMPEVTVHRAPPVFG